MITYKTTNDYYREVVDAVIEGEPFHFMFLQYYIHAKDRLGSKRPEWIDYILDSYTKYTKTGFTKMESQINSMMDGLEEILE